MTSLSLPHFVSARKPAWDELDALLVRQRQESLDLVSLRRLDALYRQATADLALAQSRFPTSDAHRFLNALCGRAYGGIYQSRSDGWRALVRFYRSGFPAAVRREWRSVLGCASVLALGVVLGMVALVFEPTAAERLIPSAVRESVRAGHLWTNDVGEARGTFATQIALNNVTVMFTAFALGVTAGFGSLGVLLFNGLHIGAVLTYCFQRGLGWGLLDFMTAHGPVELSCIVLGGTAGWIMGRAMIEPGDMPRAQRLAQRSTEAVRLVLGAAPFLAAIATIEGFVSPGGQLTSALKAAVGIALGLCFWLYLARAGRTLPAPRA